MPLLLCVSRCACHVCIHVYKHVCMDVYKRVYALCHAYNHVCTFTYICVHIWCNNVIVRMFTCTVIIYIIGVMLLLFTGLFLFGPSTTWGDVSQALIYYQV